MAILPGFEYDIFISYRHNDNLDGWVTDFVRNLEKELKGTLKDTVTIYFDTNPHDGLLETHNVDKSLEGKLKCLILIPIISQTYCDTKNFAWQHEFCAFNKLAKEDKFERDITLSNGNVASRILPVKIHELDAEDKSLLENELGGVLRAIEFIFKSAGVNRPLRANEDHPQDNSNKTFYRDQVNKVANAIKEIIISIKNVSSTSTRPTDYRSPTTDYQPNSNRKKVILTVLLLVFIAATAYFLYPNLFQSATEEEARLDKSIAVLSFVDMSPGKDQEYLGDGMAEEILNALTKIKGLKVIGRTSSFSFKGKDIDLKSIGETLGASTILEGSIQKSGNKIRITAQLINTNDETHIWSERYERELEDIFSVQDDIAAQIVQKLRGTLFVGEGETKSKTRTNNLEAYEMILKARHFRFKGLDGQKTALGYYQQAIDLDPSFAQTYAEISDVYWLLGLYGISNQNESFSKSKEAALKAVSLDENSYHGYRQLSFLNLSMDWDWPSSLQNYEKAVSLGLPLPDIQHAYYQLWLFGSNDQIVRDAEMLVEKDPLSVEALVHLSRIYLYGRRYDDVIKNGNKALEISPNHSSIFRHMGEAYLFSSRPDLAMPYFQKLMEKDPRYSPHDFIAAQVKMGNKQIALEKFDELRDSINHAKKAICYLYLGQTDKAFISLEKACQEKDAYMIVIKVDPHFDSIRSDPRYLEILKKMNFPE